MFGFIKKLITGIFSFITGLLPGKKGNGYYLQLDESGDKVAPAPKVVEKEVSPAPTVNGTKPATTTAVEAPATKSTKKPSKNGKAPQAEPAKAPAAVSNSVKTPPTETTFAPKYLAPSGSGSSRRRPGANMTSYLDMAGKMKTSN
ncbi:hypothetical protein VB620_12135 [Nodularia harveyana UHCC-0300]|uniref:Uncharacterized protein n=1 Tax=Nodularia harveyana UHCC-0300 TaxID=2974287 RepID=A0ABU5UG57_9CYAN|nr:hypothetical protein [Nodularia harveyana]MEA5582090.1 hypothetical protein [Nodularia harveyana UHCC-0300]